MADLRPLVADPAFQSLPAERQRVVASQVDPDGLGKLPDHWAQDRLLTRLAPDPYAFTEQRHGLPPGMMHALEGVESGGQQNPDTAVSPTGVRGRFQITGVTGHEFGLPDDQWDDPIAQLSTAGNILASRVQQHGSLHAGVAHYGDPNQANYADLVFAKMKGFNASSSTTDQPIPAPTLGEHIRTTLAGGEQRTEDAVRRLVGADPNVSPVSDLATVANPILNPVGLAAGTGAEVASRATGLGNPDLVNNLTQVLTAVAPSIPRMLGRVFQGARMLSPAARAAEAARPVAQTVTQTPSPVTLFDQYEKPMELATPTSSVRMITPPTPAATPSGPGFIESKLKGILIGGASLGALTGHLPSAEHLAMAGAAYSGVKLAQGAAKLYNAAMGSPITQRMMETLLTLGPKDPQYIPLSKALVAALGGPEAFLTSGDSDAAPAPSGSPAMRQLPR